MTATRATPDRLTPTRSVRDEHVRTADAPQAVRADIACALAAVVFLGGCTGNHRALDPAGPQAERISTLWWLYFWVTLLVYATVLLVVLAAVALRRRRAQESGGPIASPPARQVRRHTWIVSAAVVLTAATLLVLLFADFLTGRAIHALQERDPLSIRVTGHQWWWEVQYQDPIPANIVTAANEVHLPVGRPVRVELRSHDVIHSFWIPNLHGKSDMIPGHPTETWLRADRAGTYWGECAEFCGHQHANMRFLVVVEPQDEFDEWLKAQRQPAPPPQTGSQRRGQQVFLETTCIMCHTIRGTPARGLVGPDLTHVGSRLRIASGTLPNLRGHLAGWITDPQRIKPGVRMPLKTFSPDDLHALVDYLESLK